MTDYVVALEQRRPYELIVIETFTERSDAIDYAERYADGRVSVRLSSHRWRLPGTDHPTNLIIFNRSW
jgi:hypothetical protein